MIEQTAELLTDLVAYFTRYVVLTAEQAVAVALWTLHAHVAPTFTTTPYLIVTSAEPRSGKTRLLECLGPIVPNPDTLIAPTEAVLFRIMAELPTLLIDETDAIFTDSKFGPSEKQENLRAILNAGYRKGATVPRCLPGSTHIERFPVFGPKVLAGIGHLPATVEDRGLCIRLTRRLPDEIIERFRHETGVEWGARLKPPIERWGVHARVPLTLARPELPEELDDRAMDAYEVLIAIADLAGVEWGARARAALVALRNADTTVRESTGVKLFKDLANFVERLAKVEKIATIDFLTWLYEHGDEPWEDWWGPSGGKKAPRRLALVLSEYGVKHIRWQEDGERRRGYLVSDILTARTRYLGDNMGHLATSLQMEGFQHGHGSDSLPMLESADLQGSGQVPMLDQGVEPQAPDLGTASLDELEEWYGKDSI